MRRAKCGRRISARSRLVLIFSVSVEQHRQQHPAIYVHSRELNMGLRSE